jgi:hypothetical protein
MADSKKHHYVPQFLLRQFSDGGGQKIYVFDKRTGRVFRSNILNVAAENRLYEFSIGNLTATIEPGLAQFETNAADVLRRILAAQSLAQITILDRTVLAAFVAQLLLRSPHRKAISDDMINQVREKVRRMGTDPDQLPELKILDENEKKILTAQFLAHTWKEFIPIIAFKTWVFHRVSNSGTLYLSDNPVVMHNEMQFGPRGNLGLAVEGIELYLPLSPTSCLAMYCPKMVADLERKYREMPPSQEFVDHTRFPDRRGIVEKLFTAFRTGEPAPFDCSNVEFVNSLQVWSAERYVYAADDDFELAKDMLVKNPRLRFGPRPSVR